MVIAVNDIINLISTNNTHFLDVHPELLPDGAAAFIQGHIDEAVLLYSIDFPAKHTETITLTSEYDGPLPSQWDQRLSSIDCVEFPTGNHPPTFISNSVVTVRYHPTVGIELTSPLTIGDELYVTYYGLHSHTALATSLSLAEEPLVKLLAGYLACLAIAGKYNDWVAADFQVDLPRSDEISHRWRDTATGLKAQYDAFRKELTGASGGVKRLRVIAG